MTKESDLRPEAYKFLSTLEAQRLAELYLIQGDLNAAYETLDLYFTHYAATDVPKEGKAAIISPSLFRDGILLFCACFSRSDPDKLHPEAVYTHLMKSTFRFPICEVY